METDYKSIAVIALIIVALFAGGLYYIISENNNRRVALEKAREYINTSDPAQMASLEAEIRTRIEKPPIAMTSRASFDSFEQLISNARSCESYAVQVTFNPRAGDSETAEAWRHCMDNPEVLDRKIENSP